MQDYFVEVRILQKKNSNCEKEKIKASIMYRKDGMHNSNHETES